MTRHDTTRHDQRHDTTRHDTDQRHNRSVGWISRPHNRTHAHTPCCTATAGLIVAGVRSLPCRRVSGLPGGSDVHGGHRGRLPPARLQGTTTFHPHIFIYFSCVSGYNIISPMYFAHSSHFPVNAANQRRSGVAPGVRLRRQARPSRLPRRCTPPPHPHITSPITTSHRQWVALQHPHRLAGTTRACA
jgi:hypothetical protein